MPQLIYWLWGCRAWVYPRCPVACYGEHSRTAIKKYNMEIKIKYLVENLKKIEPRSNSDWIDLRCACDVYIRSGEYALIPLGVAMELPKGYEACIVPRSSTLKNFGIIQGNHFGVVDNSYCGNKDEWKMSAYAIRDTTISKNDRICQFRIQKKQPQINIVEVEDLTGDSRGGFGSTGIK